MAAAPAPDPHSLPGRPAINQPHEERRRGRDVAPTLRVLLAFLKTVSEEELKRFPLIGGFIAASEKISEEGAAAEAAAKFERLSTVTDMTDVTVSQIEEDVALVEEFTMAIYLMQVEILQWVRNEGGGQSPKELQQFASDSALLAYWNRLAVGLMYADHRGVANASREAHLASLPLDEVYVMPRLIKRDLGRAEHEREQALLRQLDDPDLPVEERQGLEQEYVSLAAQKWRSSSIYFDPPRLSVGDVLAQSRVVVLLGAPGVGKSVLTRWLARTCVLPPHEMVRRLGWREELTPVILPLASYADALATRGVQPTVLPLKEFVIEEMGRRGGPALADAFAEELDTGRALVLLDGIDEVPDSRIRADVVRAVDTFLTLIETNRCVITSRPAGYVPLAGDISHVQIPNFTPNQVDEFAHRWERAFERRRHPDAPDMAHADAAARSLLEELRTKPEVAALATNPLMLVIVSLIRYEELRLPEKRVQLYNRAVATLLDTWNIWRSQPRCSVGGVVLPLDRLVRVWAGIAAWARAEKPTGLLHRPELLRRLIRVLAQHEYDEEDPEATAESYLKAASEHAGLLEERATGVFAFWHSTFEEFLAAVDLTTPTYRAVERITAIHDDPRWREVVLLSVGYVGTVLRDGETASRIVMEILNCRRCGERDNYACLRLAAACVADDVGVRRSAAQDVIAELARVVTFQLGAPKTTGSPRIDPHQDPLFVALRDTLSALPRLRPSQALLFAINPLSVHYDWTVRREVARLAADMAPRFSELGQTLCRQLLSDRDSAVRCHAALGLARCEEFGPEVWRALSGLNSFFAEIEPAVTEFFNSHPDVLGVVSQWAMEATNDDKIRVSELFAALGDHSTVADLLLPLLESGDAGMRLRAAEALGRLAFPDPRVRQALSALVDDPDPTVRQLAMLGRRRDGRGTTDSAP
jgi:hypothetical protein